MKIHREGKNILFILFIILALLNLPVYLWLNITWLAYLIHAASLVFFLLIVNFFRSPKRRFKGDLKNVVVAPADGVVVVRPEEAEEIMARARKKSETEAAAIKRMEETGEVLPRANMMNRQIAVCR